MCSRPFQGLFNSLGERISVWPSFYFCLGPRLCDIMCEPGDFCPLEMRVIFDSKKSNPRGYSFIDYRTLTSFMSKSANLFQYAFRVCRISPAILWTSFKILVLSLIGWKSLTRVDSTFIRNYGFSFLKIIHFDMLMAVEWNVWRYGESCEEWKQEEKWEGWCRAVVEMVRTEWLDFTFGLEEETRRAKQIWGVIKGGI